MRRAAILVFLAGCAGRAPPVAPPDMSAELDGPVPTIAGIELPRLPLDVSIEEEPLQGGWELTERALTMPAPRPPSGEAWEVETWAEDELADWMRRRAQAISAAQHALDESRQGEPAESVVASTILGLAYARFALDVRGIGTPAAFADDTARATAYRTALEVAAQPIWQRALDAFGSCAAVAGNAPAHALDRWREHCDGEAREASAMLPGADDADEEEPDGSSSL